MVLRVVAPLRARRLVSGVPHMLVPHVAERVRAELFQIPDTKAVGDLRRHHRAQAVISHRCGLHLLVQRSGSGGGSHDVAAGVIRQAVRLEPGACPGAPHATRHPPVQVVLALLEDAGTRGTGRKHLEAIQPACGRVCQTVPAVRAVTHTNQRAVGRAIGVSHAVRAGARDIDGELEPGAAPVTVVPVAQAVSGAEHVV